MPAFTILVVTASKRNFLEILPLLPRVSKPRLDWCRHAKHTGGVCFRSEYHREKEEEKESGLSSKKVLGLLGAPPSLPPSFWITASKMELVSLSLSLYLSPILLPVKQTGVSRAVAANSRHSPNYKQYVARCV